MAYRQLRDAQNTRELRGGADRRSQAEEADIMAGREAHTTHVQTETRGDAVSDSNGEHGPLLAKTPLFATLEAEELRELAKTMRRRTFRAGEVIFHRDDPGQVLYIIREGKVRIYVTSPEGQEVALAVFGPNDSFGEMALLDGQARSASAIALDSVDTYTLQRSDFVNVVTRHPRIAVQVMSVLSRRLRQTDTMIEDLLFLDVHGRVAKKLLELADLHGVRTPEGILIDMRLTQSDLASLVGASRESVNKVLGYFLTKRYVTTEKRRITILWEQYDLFRRHALGRYI